jgi:aminopeptidase N
MLSFFSRKNWGYAEDEMVTTHSIRSDVLDTFTAESIFDGITYSKGAATMKQLMYLIGEENFSKALAAYFKKHEFSNAILDDLLSSIEPYFDQSKNGLTLEQWKQMWLETAGCNKLFCEWQPGQSKATIVQTLDRSECPTLRLHRIKVAVISSDNSITTTEVTVLPQEKTEISLPITANSVAVLLNFDDYTFAKVEIDPRSRNYFQ